MITRRHEHNIMCEYNENMTNVGILKRNKGLCLSSKNNKQMEEDSRVVTMPLGICIFRFSEKGN